ncbi:MAG: hypothetical protein AB7G12_05580 [Thermoanaerobaculia bacterium]
MRSAMVAADGNFEVRLVAMRLRRAGEIDPATEEAVARAYADDRVRTTRVFRILFFCFTWFGFSSALGLFVSFLLAAIGGSGSGELMAAVYLAAGVAALAATEFLHGVRRLRRFGVEEALVWIGVTHLVGGTTWIVHRTFDPSNGWMLLVGAWITAAMSLVAAWRWGTPGTGFVSAAALLVAVSQLSLSHPVWLAISLLTAWPLAHLSLADHISPQGRRRFREAFVVMSVAAYFALHLDVVEHRVFHFVRLDEGYSFHGVPESWLLASRVAMVVLPLVWIAAGIVRRYRPALDLGLLLLFATLTTFAVRARPRPEWLFLVGSGLSLIVVALLLRRWFGRADGAEWQGLTARTLDDERASAGALETLAALSAFSPAARSMAPEPEKLGGGEFGGGGASTRF